MIERQHIDGKPSSVIYLDADFSPVADKTAAEFVRVVLDSGESFFGKRIKRPEALTKIQLVAWAKAIMILDASEVMVRDLIERELAGIAGTRGLPTARVLALANRLVRKVNTYRLQAIKTAFRLLRTRLGNTTVLDHSLATWAKAIVKADAQAIGTAIQNGLVAGNDSTEIARKVVGSLGLNGVDGVTEFTRHKMAHLGRAAIRESRQKG